MKNIVLRAMAPVILAAPMLAHAGPVIDLKSAIKAGVQQGQGTPSAGAAPVAGIGASEAQGQSPDSAKVSLVLANIKTLDVGGVRLGMSGDEAKQVLKKLNPSFHQEPLSVGGSSAVRGFVMTNDARTSQVYPSGMDRFTVYVNEAGNVFFVERQMRQLPPERQIAATTFFSTLLEKYDVPGLDTRGRGEKFAAIGWMFDMQGRQFSDPGNGHLKNPCQHQGYGSDVLGFQQQPLPTCAAEIHASGNGTLKNRELLDGYTVKLSAPWLWHDTGAVRASEEASARQRQAEQDKVKANKPQL